MVERGERVHTGLAKALTLARHTGARLELFLCETEPCPGGLDRQDRTAGIAREQCLQRGHEYLRALRHGILCADVRIDEEVAWAPSLLQGVSEKLRRTPVQMIVRAPGQLDNPVAVFARHLLGRSGTPLLLTRGRPWQALPWFATVLQPGRGAAAPAPIGQLSELLRRCSGARLDYVIGHAIGLADTLAERNYDLITLALPSAAREADAGTARLLQATDADVLVVETAPAVSTDACEQPEALRFPRRKPL